jgi:hypothetical protein
MRGVIGAIGLLVLGIAAAVVSAPVTAATYTNSLTGGFAGFDVNLLPTVGPFAAVSGPTGAVLTKAYGPSYGGVELLSRFTFSGAYVVGVDVAGLSTELGFDAESGIGLKAPGCCSPTTNFQFADIFGHGNNLTLVNNHVGATGFTRTPIVGGDRLTISGDTGGAQFRFNLFLDQSFGAADANRVEFTNVVLTADAIAGAGAAAIPEPAAWSLMIAGFGLIGSALRRRSVNEGTI